MSAESQMAAATHRAVADFIDAHPDLPPPFVSVYDHRPDKADLRWYLNINDKGDEAIQRALAVAIVRGVGGKWDKDFSDNEARFEQTRAGMNMLVTVQREAVCERRVVGTESVTLPAVAAQPERTVERELVEWDCSPVLAEVAS
jgi:hypothetical protein